MHLRLWGKPHFAVLTASYLSMKLEHCCCRSLPCSSRLLLCNPASQPGAGFKGEGLCCLRREELGAGKTIHQALTALCSTWQYTPCGLASLSLLLGVPGPAASCISTSDAGLLQQLSRQPAKAYEVSLPGISTLPSGVSNLPPRRMTPVALAGSVCSIRCHPEDFRAAVPSGQPCLGQGRCICSIFWTGSPRYNSQQ